MFLTVIGALTNLFDDDDDDDITDMGGGAMCHFYTDALLSKFLTFVEMSFFMLCFHTPCQFTQIVH